MLGGLAGAKLLYVFEHWAEPLSETLLSRGGMSWFGGLTGGVLAGLAMMAWQRLPLMAVLAAAAPAMTLGQAVGRIGCFLVGDDYGRPTSLPWGMAFPEGLPPTTERVHPAQLYEAAILFPMAWLLVRMRRQGMADRAVFGWYLLIGRRRAVPDRAGARERAGRPRAQHRAVLFDRGADRGTRPRDDDETWRGRADGSGLGLKTQGRSGSAPAARRPKP